MAYVNGQKLYARDHNKGGEKDMYFYGNEVFHEKWGIGMIIRRCTFECDHVCSHAYNVLFEAGQKIINESQLNEVPPFYDSEIPHYTKNPKSKSKMEI